MKKVLFATDFSEDARSAFEYALHLCKEMKAELLILHTYTPVYTDYATPVSMVENYQIEMIESFQKQLDKLVTTANEIGVKTTGKLLLSDVGNGVNDTVEEETADFIVVGKTGTSGFLSKLVGSNVSVIIKKAKVPVFVIPQNLTEFKTKAILYGSQLEFDEINQLSQTVELAKALNGELSLIHIKALDELDIIDNTKLLKEIKEAFPTSLFKVEEIKSNSVVDGLMTSINLFQGDLLVVSSHHRSFLSQLLNPSKSQDIASKTTIPLLVFHFEEKY